MPPKTILRMPASVARSPCKGQFARKYQMVYQPGTMSRRFAAQPIQGYLATRRMR
jgi:hypothetical protein